MSTATVSLWVDSIFGIKEIWFTDLGPDHQYNVDDDGGIFRITSFASYPQVAPSFAGDCIAWTELRSEEMEDAKGRLYCFGPNGQFDGRTGDDSGVITLPVDASLNQSDGMPNSQFDLVASEEFLLWSDNRNRLEAGSAQKELYSASLVRLGDVTLDGSIDAADPNLIEEAILGETSLDPLQLSLQNIAVTAGAELAVNFLDAEVLRRYYYGISAPNGSNAPDYLPVIFGDLDGDGEVNATDCEAADELFDRRLEPGYASRQQLFQADVNRNGLFDLHDISLLCDFVSGQIARLPFTNPIIGVPLNSSVGTNVCGDFTVSARDLDGELVTLVDSSLPTGATLTESPFVNSSYRWNINWCAPDELGSYDFTFAVEDELGNQTTRTRTLEVVSCPSCGGREPGIGGGRRGKPPGRQDTLDGGNSGPSQGPSALQQHGGPLM